MQLFHTKKVKDGIATLNEEESRHCTQVLRKRLGDVIVLIDGLGTFYEGSILEINKRACSVQITKSWRDTNPEPVRLHIAIAPTKNISRFEWFLEKVTEIGISQISPILCKYSERKQIRLDRLSKIILSAVKQSQRAALPEISPLISFEQFLKESASSFSQKYIAYINENVNSHLSENYQSGEDVCILIGPEGGFSREEAELAFSFGFEPISLGHHRLRTETAGLVACHTVKLKNLNV